VEPLPTEEYDEAAVFCVIGDLPLVSSTLMAAQGQNAEAD
jgi:hypothetical protein